MARYILIDNNSGFIWGDSADFNGKVFKGSAIEFAEALDQSIGGECAEREYVEHAREPHGEVEGYHVYRAERRGAKAIKLNLDGQSREALDEVKNKCSYEGFIEFE